jgi:signal transduction histidine kinase
VRLVIADDGVGLAQEALQKLKSHGVVGMRERMRLLGGRLANQPSPSGTGTIVDAFIPATRRPASSAA